MTSLIKQRKGLGIASVIAGGAIGLALTLGSLVIATPVEMWKKVGQTIYPTPTTLALDSASTTVSSLKVSQTGTRITALLKGTCDLIGMDVSQTATTTSVYDCAVTGAVAGDLVLVGQPTTTPTTNLGWKILGANASSTSGYITVNVQNLTGGNAVPSATSVGSSTPYLIIR